MTLITVVEKLYFTLVYISKTILSFKYLNKHYFRVTRKQFQNNHIRASKNGFFNLIVTIN